MFELNFFIGSGNVVGELKRKEGENGKPNITSFDVAIKYKEIDEKGQNYRVVTYGTVADEAIKTLSENDRVLIRGKIQQKKFQPKSGSEVTFWQIVASSVDLMSKGVAGRIKPDIDDDYDF